MKISVISFMVSSYNYRRVTTDFNPHPNKRMCVNCRHFVYNRFIKDYFCGKHKTPIAYFEVCGYFKFIWLKKL